MVEISEEKVHEINTHKKSVQTKVPEVEIHLYKSGKGPIDVFKSKLGGWDQNQLEVQEILEKYELKSLFAFNSDSVRGVPIVYNPRNGRSETVYRDGAVVYLDGEPKDPMIKPITKILVGVAFLTVMIAVVMKDPPKWLNLSTITNNKTFPPWIIACMVIAFMRLRKRTKNLLMKKIR